MADTPQVASTRQTILTLMVIVVTSVLTALGSCVAQRSASDRELRNTLWRQERENAVQILTDVSQRVARTVDACDAFLALPRGAYDRWPQERQALYQKAQAGSQDWKLDRYALDVRLALSYGSHAGASQAWQGLRASLDAYHTCANDWYEEWREKTTQQVGCAHERAGVATAFDAFRETSVSALRSQYSR
jgi:hypothetical protein